MATVGQAQQEKTKTVERTFDLTKEGRVAVDHRYGLLKVVASKDDKVHLTARIRIQGTDNEEIERALSQFEVDINEFGNQVTIETDLGIKNWNGRNGRITLTFKNGAKVKGLKKFTVEMLLAVPELQALSLKNKYEDIIIDHDFRGDVEVSVYDGDFRAQKIGGELEMTVKYGKAFLTDIQNADITLYDSEMELGAAKDVRLSSKYSELTIGDTDNLKIKAYDDKMELGNVRGKLEISDRYSEFRMGSFNTAFFDIYDADLVGKKGKSMTVFGSRYSSFKFGAVEELMVDESYDDKFTFKEVGNFKVSKSRYTEFNVDNLTGAIGLLASYDDQLDIASIADSFEGLKVDGKYTKVNMRIPTSVKYKLDAAMTHGNIDYPEDDFESQYYKEKSSILEVRGQVKGALADAPIIEVRGYDCQIKLW